MIYLIGRCFFQARITVSVSSLLILATILGTESRTLPETTQITFVEIWMTFVSLLNFAEIVLHTIIVYVQCLETEKSNLVKKINVNIAGKNAWFPKTNQAHARSISNKINHVCGRVLFPSIFMVCTITYCIIAMYTYNTKNDSDIFGKSECDHN